MDVITKKNFSFAFILLFITSMILLPATRLQIGHTPITIGNLLLLVFVVWSLLSSFNFNHVKPFIVFIAIILLSMMIGWGIEYKNTHTINPMAIHDIFAYLLCLLLIIALGHRDLNLNNSLFWVAIVVPLMSWFFIADPNSWFSRRYLALALNPNQLAFALSVLPFILLQSVTHEKWKQVLVVASLISIIVIGLLTECHALILAWTIACLFYTANYVLSKRPRNTYQELALQLFFAVIPIIMVIYFNETFHFIILCTINFIHQAIGTPFVFWLTIVSILIVQIFVNVQLVRSNKKRPLLLILMFALSSVMIFSLISYFHQYSHHITKTIALSDGEPAVRYELLTASVGLAKKTVFFGYGPGSFITTVTSLGNVAAYEAHNVFIDLFLQTGIFGLLSYCVMLGLLLIRCRKNPVLMMALITILVFSMFHFLCRQPFFWLFLYWIYQQTLVKETQMVEEKTLSVADNNDCAVPLQG